MPASRTSAAAPPHGNPRRSGLGRALAILALAGFASAGLVLAGLASIPHFFGRDVGAGFASVEHRLCALDADGSAQILIGGDSRARLLLDPAVFDSSLGRRTVNIAEMVNFGGDLPTLVNVLRKHPEALAGGPVLLLSVSIPGHNDLDLAGLTAAGVLNWTAWDHARVAWRKPAAYARYLAEWYLPFLRRHLLHAWKGDGFACSDGMALSAAQMASRGFSPDARVFDPGSEAGKSAGLRPGFRSRDDFLLDGGRDRAFSRSLAWLAQSPAKAIVLYNAPVAASGDGPGQRLEREMEARFAERVAAAAAGHPKVRFLDFVREPPPDIGPEHFADNYHLNAAGAAIFSRRLAAYLAGEGL